MTVNQKLPDHFNNNKVLHAVPTQGDAEKAILPR
jgi:hypothetical protein